MPTTNYLTIDGAMVSQAKAGTRTDLLTDGLGNTIATVGAGAAVSNRTTYWPKGEEALGGVRPLTKFGYQGASQSISLVPDLVACRTTLYLTPLAQVLVPDHRRTGRPSLPPGESFAANCCEAMSRRPDLGWFYNQVRNGGPWDYKQRKPKGTYANGGNFNYGFIAACMGLPLDIALWAAGQAQKLAGTSRPEWCRELVIEDPFQPIIVPLPPYGDDPEDQDWIRKGYGDAQRWLDELRRKCHPSTLQRCYGSFKRQRDQIIEDGLKEGEIGAPWRWWERQ